MRRDIWGYSSAGRALEWHSRGQRFDPAYLHQEDIQSGVLFLLPFQPKNKVIFCNINYFLNFLIVSNIAPETPNAVLTQNYKEKTFWI